MAGARRAGRAAARRVRHVDRRDQRRPRRAGRPRPRERAVGAHHRPADCRHRRGGLLHRPHGLAQARRRAVFAGEPPPAAYGHHAAGEHGGQVSERRPRARVGDGAGRDDRPRAAAAARAGAAQRNARGPAGRLGHRIGVMLSNLPDAAHRRRAVRRRRLLRQPADRHGNCRRCGGDRRGGAAPRIHPSRIRADAVSPNDQAAQRSGRVSRLQPEAPRPRAPAGLLRRDEGASRARRRAVCVYRPVRSARRAAGAKVCAEGRRV